jgi:hypothetical protein
LGIEAATERHLPDALAHDDFLTRMNWGHPAAPEAAAIVSRAFRERIPPVARLLLDGKGETYADLVRTTHERADVERIVAREFANGERLLAMAESERGLLKVPRPVLPSVLRLAGDVLSWYKARTAQEIDAIFGHGGAKAAVE